MKYANVDGKRREAQPGHSAKCPDCGAAMTAKCGRYRVWHWAHQGRRNCDPWSEPETEWHRFWKNQFPEHCQEVRHIAKDGEIHRADVKTEFDVVLEFQHSPLSEVERVSREQFYGNMIWVVNGQRRKRDRAHFF